MKRYEYEVVGAPVAINDIHEWLNARGAEGWHLSTTIECLVEGVWRTRYVFARLITS